MKLNQIKYLLSPDTAEGTLVDPLSEAVGNIDTSFPVLMPDRVLRFAVKSATKEKSDKGGEYIQIKVRLEQDGTFRDGKIAHAGFAFNQTIGVTPTEKYDIDAIKRNVAVWLKPLLGEKAKEVTVRQFIDTPSMIDGVVFDARTGVKKDKNGAYPDATVITPMLPS